MLDWCEAEFKRGLCFVNFFARGEFSEVLWNLAICFCFLFVELCFGNFGCFRGNWCSGVYVVYVDLVFLGGIPRCLGLV